MDIKKDLLVKWTALYWSPQEIEDYYDSHLNMTLKELSRLCSWSIPDLKRLLLRER